MARASSTTRKRAGAPTPSLHFAGFELRPDDRQLLRDGQPVALRAKAFDVLAALAARAGRLVSKGELLDLVWPGLVVEENNIAAQMVALRKVIGGSIVQTVPGHGYRFAAPVEEVGAVERGGDAAAPERAAPERAAVAHPSTPTGLLLAAPPQRLFGRDEDRRRLHAALDGGGCVTLVGAGGVGKTVLARSVAAERRGCRASWVELTAVTAEDDLPAAVCRALGAPVVGRADELDSSPSAFDLAIAALASADVEAPAAAAALSADGSLQFAPTTSGVAAPRARGLLVVLDNAEHVVDAVARLAAAALAAAPNTTLLITSQLPLGIAGERVQPVEPLTLPADDLSDDGTLEHAAVALLVERIRGVDPRFPLDATALPRLRQLASRLDGLPLALEMAAAVVPLLGLANVVAALDRRFDLLRRGHREAPARHRTLRAALEWSHGLLSQTQACTLRRVAVFASSFPLELAVAVAVATEQAEAHWDTVDAFASLVDRSLVVSLHADPPRYRLSETVRAFALERLAAAPATEAACVRLTAVRALAERLRSIPPDEVGEATADLANVPEMLAWARVNDPAGALDLCLAAATAATWTAWRSDSGRWIETCEPLLGAEGINLKMQAAWWREFARQQTFVRGSRTVEAARRAARLERERGDDDGLFWSLVPLLRARTLPEVEFDACRDEAAELLARHPDWPPRAHAVFAGSLALELRRRGDFEAALRFQKEEVAQARRAGLHQAARNAESNVAATLIGLGRYEDALALLDARAAAATDDGDPACGDAIGAHDRVQRLNALIGLGRLDEARAWVPEAVRWCRRFDVLDVVQVVAALQAECGRLAEAALLLGHHRAALARLGAEPPMDDHAPWRDAERRIAAGIDPAVAASAAERGAALGPSQADAAMVAAALP